MEQAGAGSTATKGTAPAHTDAGERASSVACPVALCPICLTVTALGEARPELVTHLLAAGREVLHAMRALIDARLEETEPPPKLKRLVIE
jgi:hypothetical protein